ncbi:uncharacterized protein LOC121344376 [Onychostruthus taczanowskii]|uniref:uncharacterized protein LOC121344376 n=1 Tax=Onychostruthus taczanowskii TaxID=356909 RepID=UPI001B806A86|nr:uncharacterized protein LOC121344376 [Onychostruthus taczanowskii]
MVSMCCVTAQHCPVSQPTTVLERWQLVQAAPMPSAGLSPSLPRMPVCSELGGAGTAVGAEGRGGDKYNIGSTTASPVGLSRHGGDGDRRGDTPALSWAVGSTTRTECTQRARGHSSQQSSVVTHTQTDIQTHTHTYCLPRWDSSWMHRAVYPELCPEPRPRACPARVCTMQSQCTAVPASSTHLHTHTHGAVHAQPAHASTRVPHRHCTHLCTACGNAHVPTSTRSARTQSLCTPTPAPRAVHTSVCSVIHINTRMSQTGPCSHLQSLCTLTSTELCIDPLTSKCAIPHTCTQQCTHHVCTSARPCAQCCAHQHTWTLCKAGRVHSLLGTPENTRAHNHAHYHTCAPQQLCVHTEPCTVAHMCTVTHPGTHMHRGVTRTGTQVQSHTLTHVCTEESHTLAHSCTEESHTLIHVCRVTHTGTCAQRSHTHWHTCAQSHTHWHTGAVTHTDTRVHRGVTHTGTQLHSHTHWHTCAQ